MSIGPSAINHATFTQTGRPVVNDVRASFGFADGQIVEHRDRFDWWRWARQALGQPGLLLGWNPLFHNAARSQAQWSVGRISRAGGSLHRGSRHRRRAGLVLTQPCETQARPGC
jgi:hypothetical protein